MPDRRWPLLFALMWAACGLATPPAAAEVAVFSNRTHRRLTVSMLADGTAARPFTMEVGESRPVFYRRALSVRFGGGIVQQTYQVAAKSAYFFTRGQGDEPLRIEQIGFIHNKPLPSEPADLRVTPQAVDIPVKILVDDDEPTHRRIWEANLRRRFAAAADVIERHSGVKFHIVAVGTWQSDNRLHDFARSLREFERTVTPSPARLAIGFTSQYDAKIGRVHMGGTRGALHPYILLKERSPTMLETERIQLLVHEMGHYLGASHSPEPQSVMRPLLTNDVQRRAGARIGFDPVNTLLVAMVGDEMRNRGVRNVPQLSQPTRLRMEEIYRVLAKALPEDPAASQYLRLLALTTAQPKAQHVVQQQPKPIPAEAQAVLNGTRRTLGLLTQTVRSRRPESAGDGSTAPPWYTGDQLTEFYVRQAALSVVQLEPAESEKVFLLSLGLFFDDSGALRQFPATMAFATRADPDGRWKNRQEILGSPTLRDRHDLAQHFFISAHLAATLGPQAALGLGLAKEMSDANGGSGFSFIDLAADRAGIEFARRVEAGEITLEDLSERFAVDDYFPPVDGLVEGLQLAELKSRFGDPSDDAFQQEFKRVESRVLALPVYNRARPADKE